MIDILKEKHIVKARKHHKCDYCNKIITIGEKYISSTYAYDGSIYDWKECDRCKPFVQEAFSNKYYNWEEGMSGEDFREYMLEEHKDIAKQWWIKGGAK